MPKNDETGGLVSPENLWGKPLKRPPGKSVEEPVKGATGMRADDEDAMEDEEIDVDDELATADEEADEEEETEYDDATASVDDDDDDEDDEEDDEEGEEGEVDELEYAPEAGDGADEEADENVVSAVDGDKVEDEEAEETDADEDAGYAATHTESRKRSMADKKKVSLSDHVRAEIDKRQNAGASLRGVDIVAALEKRGIAVSAAQVSQLLKKAGLGGSPRGRRAAAPAAAQTEKSRVAEKSKKHGVTAVARPAQGLKRHPVQPSAEPRAAGKVPAKAGNGFNVPMDQLKAVETFVAACGGSFAAAGRILTAAQQLSETFGG
jgi:hypothetical protein